MLKIPSLSFSKHLFYTLLSSLLLIITVYFPTQCLIPEGLQVFRLPLILTKNDPKKYRFSIAKNATYCFLLEKDRVFPLQENEYQEKPFQTLEELIIDWKIEDNQQTLQKGTTLNQPFKGAINAKEVNRTIDCFALSKGNYAIQVLATSPKIFEPYIYRIKLNEDVKKKAKMVAWVSFYTRMVLITLLTVTTSILSLFFFFKLTELVFIKMKTWTKNPS